MKAAPLATAALLAAAIPAALAGWVRARSEALERRLADTLGVPVQLGDVEVGLTGTLRLSDVRLGEVFAADAVEAGVSLPSLLAGRLGADEVVVVRPRLASRVGDDGELELTALLERARAARRSRGGAEGAPGAASRSIGGVKRIVVRGGELTLSVAGRGELRAEGVELHPQAGGVRVVTGRVALSGEAGALGVEARFARAGVDVTVPALRVERAALAGGEIVVRSAGGELALSRVVVQKERGGAAVLDARVGAGEGLPLHVSVDRGGGADGGARVVEIEAPKTALAVFAPIAPAGLDLATAEASGKLSVSEHAGRVKVSARGHVAGLAVNHALVARSAVPVDGELQVDGEWDAAAGEARAGFEVARAGVRVKGELEGRLGTGGALRAGRLWLSLGDTPCAEALAALPAPLRAPVDGLVLDGRLSGSAEIAFDRDAPNVDAASIFEIDLAHGCKAVSDAPKADATAVAKHDFVHTLPDGRARKLGAGDGGFVPLVELPRHVVSAFVAGEDARFFVHDGFDPDQIRRSFAINVAAGKALRGGSTISQQLAKNLFLSREKTVTRKLLEAVLTWRLEAAVPKARLLEAYFSIIELGEGVYGLEEAAQHWFGKSARRLEVVEAAFLAALTPAPLTLGKQVTAAGKIEPSMRARVDIILRAMWRSRFLSADELARALRAPLVVKVGPERAER